jgi:hypothetical protein
MSNYTSDCKIAEGLYRVEREARLKVNAATDSNLQLAYGLVAISCQKSRFSHEDHCPCCAAAMAVAA